MLLFTDLPVTCTAEDAAALIARHAPQLGITGAPPDVRTLRLWRAKRILTISGRHFTRQNVLEALVIMRLRQEGMAQAHAAQRVQALDEERLHQLLTTTSTMNIAPSMASLPMSREPDPKITVQLLATGITALYARVRKGAVVGHSDHTRAGYETTPVSLYQAMALLGRHYFAEGHEDIAASVHQVLSLCQQPLKNWAPHVIAESAEYGDTILIDPGYLVPSEECETIAEMADGAELSNLIERRLHENLRITLKALPRESADFTYTTVREFVGRHPLVTRRELGQLRFDSAVPDEAFRYVDSLYRPVHSSEARGGFVRRCAHCNGLVSAADGACLLAGCRDDHPQTEDTEPVPLAEALVALPETLKFWADPAREELHLYDALRTVPQLHDHVRLYPHSDWCDVSIGEEVGVDVKDYRDPARLAQRLNRSIGRLDQYPTRILAIAQRRWTPTYGAMLVEHLTPERRRELQVMNIKQTIHVLKRWPDVPPIGGASQTRSQKGSSHPVRGGVPHDA